MKAIISYEALKILSDRKKGRAFVNYIRDKINKPKIEPITDELTPQQ
jgi:hypothetical protein